MAWYQTTDRIALRKHMLRVDLRVYPGDQSNYTNPNEALSSIGSILSAAIIKGLDVIGIVANDGPMMGWQARQLAKQKGIDLWVIPGEEYRCADNTLLTIYNLEQPMKLNLPMARACAEAHRLRGFVIACEVSKRQASEIEKLKGTPNGPDAVEVFNAAQGGFSDNKVDLPLFVSSCAKSAKELELTNVFSFVNRRELEGMGLLPEDTGIDYLPQYLERADRIEEGVDPNTVAEGAGVQAPAPTQQTGVV